MQGMENCIVGTGVSILTLSLCGSQGMSVTHTPFQGVARKCIGGSLCKQRLQVRAELEPKKEPKLGWVGDGGRGGGNGRQRGKTLGAAGPAGRPISTVLKLEHASEYPRGLVKNTEGWAHPQGICHWDRALVQPSAL